MVIKLIFGYILSWSGYSSEESNVPCIFKVFLLGCFLFSYLLGTAQSRIDLEGRVYSAEAEVMGTHIVNLNLQRATIADGHGFFTISVKKGDTLVFTAVQFKRKELIVTQKLLDSEWVVVRLEESLTELNEVVVTPYNLSGNMAYDVSAIPLDPIVDASSLGLLNKKTRRVANGFLKTVKLSRYADLIIGYDTVKLQPKIYLVPKIITIYDDISGNTKRRKIYSAIEEENKCIEQLRRQYTDAAFTQELKIPENNIIDFITYCSIDSGFERLVSTEDYLRLWDFIREKSSAYLDDHRFDN